jgi:hypothetical protein
VLCIYGVSVCCAFYRKPVCSKIMAGQSALYFVEFQCALYLWWVGVICILQKAIVLNIYGGSVCSVFCRRPVCSVFMSGRCTLYFIEGQCALYLSRVGVLCIL